MNICLSDPTSFASTNFSQSEGGSKARVHLLVDIHAMRALGSSVASLDIFQFGSTDVRPSAKLIKTKTGNVTRSISSVSLWSNGATAFHCAIRNAWVRGIALGIPVVPEVNEISATVLGSATEGCGGFWLWRRGVSSFVRRRRGSSNLIQT